MAPVVRGRRAEKAPPRNRDRETRRTRVELFTQIERVVNNIPDLYLDSLYILYTDGRQKVEPSKVYYAVWSPNEFQYRMIYSSSQDFKRPYKTVRILRTHEGVKVWVSGVVIKSITIPVTS